MTTKELTDLYSRIDSYRDDLDDPHLQEALDEPPKDWGHFWTMLGIGGIAAGILWLAGYGLMCAVRAVMA